MASSIPGHCGIVTCELVLGVVSERQVKRFGLYETTVVSDESRAVRAELQLGSGGQHGGGQEKHPEFPFSGVHDPGLRPERNYQRWLRSHSKDCDSIAATRVHTGQ